MRPQTKRFINQVRSNLDKADGNLKQAQTRKKNATPGYKLIAQYRLRDAVTEALRNEKF